MPGRRIAVRRFNAAHPVDEGTPSPVQARRWGIMDVFVQVGVFLLPAR